MAGSSGDRMRAGTREELVDEGGSERKGGEVRCAECGTFLLEGQDREVTDGGVFCRHCFTALTAQLQQVVATQGEDVGYAAAALGGLAGAAVGILAWWGFTVLTHVAFGLVAVVIGVAVGKGVVMASGDKRHSNLQVLSVLISVAGFLYATYLVNRTFILRAYAEKGEAVALPLLPEPGLFFGVVAAGFDLMDLVFLAIVVYEAWKIPAPLKLALDGPA
jgi:hypothetical protein